MVSRMELAYDENIDILDTKHIAGSTIVYNSLPGVSEINDINLMLKSLLPNEITKKIELKISD